MKSDQTSIRVGVIFEHFGPYHLARLEGANQREELEVVPIELFSDCDEYAWETPGDSKALNAETVFNGKNPSEVTGQETENRLRELLSRLELDALAVHGWSLPGATAAIRWAHQNRCPCIVMSESRYVDSRRRWFTETIKRQLLGPVSAGLVGADSHRRYLTSLGIPENGIYFGYNAVDNQYFATEAENARGDAKRLRDELGLPARYLFASNRFIEKKNLGRLLTAYSSYHAEAENPWSLVLAGDGPLKVELECRVQDQGLSEHVLFPGFLQYDQLPVYYGLASAFVHVSTTEQWGLVVNEAAAAGLPLVVSDQCGCSPHLVEDGLNGFTCDAKDTMSISVSLCKMIELDDQCRSEMGRRSAEIVSGYGPKQFGLGLTEAARFAIANPRSIGLFQRLALTGLGWLNLTGSRGN